MSAPPTPAIAALTAKAAIFRRLTRTPLAAAAFGATRSATNNLPSRERTRKETNPATMTKPATVS
jgi:hypothetical protein